MKIKKTLTASVVVFALFLIMDYVLHGILLRGLYAETASLWRAPGTIQRLAWIIGAVDAAVAFLLVWLYDKGLETRKAWLGQGARFGLAVGLIFSLPMGFSMYAMMPVPFILGLGWFAGALVEFVVAGIAAAFVLRS